MPSTPHESSPLLPSHANGNGEPHLPLAQRLVKLLKAEGEPSWLQSYNWFIFGSYANILLLFVPLSAVAHYQDWDAALRFVFSFLAIIPLAKLLGDATENLSGRLGEILAGLLNASFGNAVEIIVGIAALLRDEIRIVQTSMIGSILSNILLVLGCSFVAAGWERAESSFQVTAAQASSSLMTLACITLVIPAAYHMTMPETASSEHGLVVISRGTAIVLLLVYGAYLLFQLKSHHFLFQSESEEGDEPPTMNVAAAAFALLGVTVVTSFCADYLVASIEETAERYHISKTFIGLILLPIVANAAEHVTSIWMAMKNKMELAITICVGSSIQIASFVVPLMVIIGWCTNHELTLYFEDFETIILFVSVLLVNTLIQDGKSNYMEGLLLLALYFVIALAYYNDRGQWDTLTYNYLPVFWVLNIHRRWLPQTPSRVVAPFEIGQQSLLGAAPRGDNSFKSNSTSIAFISLSSVMDIEIRYVHSDENEWSVTRAIAEILHAGESEESRKVNFQVKLDANPAGVGHKGTGRLTVPTSAIGRKFLDDVKETPIKLSKQKLKFRKCSQPPKKYIVETLAKTPFVSPDIEEKHAKTLEALEEKLRIDTLQFGVYYRPSYPGGRAFSVEWEKNYTVESAAWLHFEYDHKLIRLKLGDELREKIGHNVNISFASIRKIGVGYDWNPYICFDTLTPPTIEEVELHRTLTGDHRVDNEKYKHRVGHLDERHRAVAPYATQVRVVLYNDTRYDMIKKFIGLCKVAGIGNDGLIAHFAANKGIEAVKQGFFEPKRMYTLHKRLAALPWHVAFQMEALLLNGLLHTKLIQDLLDQVEALAAKHMKNNNAHYVGEVLRKFNEVLQSRLNIPEVQEHPLTIFENVLSKFEYAKPSLDRGTFPCCHVTFTPTRVLLEGPCPTQSNRIIRKYAGFEDKFLRVDFRDEDRLQYRWDREVDGSVFVRDRVGTVLKLGFELAGRTFEFLAYSSSALREHAVWFMSPFKKDGVIVDAESIRNSVGDFKGTELLKRPSMYAARLAQAFTATDPSVKIRRGEWEDVDDLGEKPYLFTDGVGTISSALADRIWAAVGRKNQRRPDAFQIRFLGYKGMVSVDKELDNHPHGIQMRLRPSMRKFENKGEEEDAEIEIAQSFSSPNAAYLNRPLVMLLEDLGARKEDFLRLQNLEIADACTIDESLEQFQKFMSGHGLGRPFGFQYLLRKLWNLGLDLSSNKKGSSIDTPFLHLLRSVAINDVLRDIKHSARIKIPDSYLLVGIADEGPAYEKRGYKNVYSLREGNIYACIQRHEDDEPTYIQGTVSISRSPVAHRGDVQRVYAIGEPPAGMFCAFRGLRNVVVLPSVGDRSLASCLGGGDVDGDMFSVITCDALLPSETFEPSAYESAGTKTLDRDSTVEDICDFVVEYINSDVLGLLSDRLLIIADQSKDGFSDEACLALAELCSQAVDYPKQGIPVDLDSNDLPRTLIRCKPDWHAAEVVSPRETDYYRSTRALGFLYRAVELKPITEEEKKLAPNKFPPLTDAISRALIPYVKTYLGAAVNPNGQFAEIDKIFQRYVNELNYICITHTLSNTPGVKLLEAEVVAGTILAKCAQKRMRSDRIYRMRLHSETLVKDVQKDFKGRTNSPDSLDGFITGLGRAWRAWEYSQKYNDQFGANSFGIIALSVTLDSLEGLGTVLPTREKEY
ncbi:calcium ion transporter [Coprinopsis cinerea AmutBmut pab1-1]|nr:calcium ion transporter [Coprinopsis cinerea AmutBmut pab1-1]